MRAAESETSDGEIYLRNAPGPGDVFVIVSPKYFVEELSSPEMSGPSMTKIHGGVQSFHREGVPSRLYLQLTFPTSRSFLFSAKLYQAP